MLGGQESRGVLRKISDMLEVIMKRMDALSKLGNTTDTHRLDELSSALDRYSMLVSKACRMCFTVECTLLSCRIAEEGSICTNVQKLQLTVEESALFVLLFKSDGMKWFSSSPPKEYLSRNVRQASKGSRTAELNGPHGAIIKWKKSVMNVFRLSFFFKMCTYRGNLNYQQHVNK